MSLIAMHNEGSCALCTGWHDAEEAAFMNRRRPPVSAPPALDVERLIQTAEEYLSLPRTVTDWRKFFTSLARFAEQERRKASKEQYDPAAHYDAEQRAYMREVE